MSYQVVSLGCARAATPTTHSPLCCSHIALHGQMPRMVFDAVSACNLNVLRAQSIRDLPPLCLQCSWPTMCHSRPWQCDSGARFGSYPSARAHSDCTLTLSMLDSRSAAATQRLTWGATSPCLARAAVPEACERTPPWSRWTLEPSSWTGNAAAPIDV